MTDWRYIFIEVRDYNSIIDLPRRLQDGDLKDYKIIGTIPAIMGEKTERYRYPNILILEKREL